MLTPQRHEMILELLKEKGSITTIELCEILGISESTARRDINYLDQEGKLQKVFGGAVETEQQVTAHEYSFEQKNTLYTEEKRKIACYAAGLIEDSDFVYLDAGTTTAFMADYMEHTGAAFVTNGITHAQKLAAKGFRVYLTGGELKVSTKALVGNFALETLSSYHFTKGFFGTNGVTKQSGCTTPDVNEALVKKAAMNQCKQRYVLCDASKFGEVSSVTFAPFEGVSYICNQRMPGYEKCRNLIVVEERS